MDLTHFLNEENWAPLERDGKPTSYTRPMYGSEVLLHQTHKFIDGLGEVVMGITLDTTLELEALKAKLLDGLAYCRFVSPILGATVEAGVYDPDLPSWVYTPVASAEAAKVWAIDSLDLVEGHHAPEDFIRICNQRRLPYVRADGVEQYFHAFLIADVNGKPAFAIHGTHAIFDAHPNLNFFYVLLTHVAGAKPEENPAGLEWGTEWKNLPPGPIIATGGAKPDWDIKGMQLFGIMQQTLNTPNPTLSMKPARDVPKHPGINLRVHEVVDKEHVLRLIKKSKEMGYTITQLFEAAHALAIFHSNKDVDPEQDIHVTMEGSYISLFKFLVPPYNTRTHVIGAMAMVPIKHPGSIVRDHKEIKDQLIAGMDNLKASYSQYVSNPHISAVTAVAGRMMPLKTVPATRNPNEAVITNIGVIERLIPLKYPESEPVVEIDDLWFGHRLQSCPKLIVHFWTMKGQIHLLTQTNDTWDEDYLRDFLRRIVSIADVIL